MIKTNWDDLNDKLGKRRPKKESHRGEDEDVGMDIGSEGEATVEPAPTGSEHSSKAAPVDLSGGSESEISC